jgi:tetratricopeptide (TPR) repeat protein
MPEIAISIADLRLLGGRALDAVPEAEWPAEIAKLFDFMPGTPHVRIEGGTAYVSFVGEGPGARQEAARLYEQASRKAQKGEYSRAIDLFARSLAANPADTAVRRDLAMACMEAGRLDEAEDHLIEVLRLDPADAWAFVILGNLFVRHRKDSSTAVTFYRRALELKPGDAWALNGVATAAMEAGRMDDAIVSFDAAIASQPDFAQARCGKALAQLRDNQPGPAVETLSAFFATAKREDARTEAVFREARNLLFSAQSQLAAKRESDAFKEIETLRRQVEASSGYPVEILTEDLGHLSGQARMAWKHGRDRHVIALNSSTPPPP